MTSRSASPVASALDPALERDLVFVAAGAFTMGASSEDKFATDCERPAHRVTFPRGYFIARHPVTVAEFRHFAPQHDDDAEEDWPVVNVSWHDANAYCTWLTRELGTRFRLPTEAEWENACRAGSTAPFHTGDDISTSQANYLYSEIGRRIGLGSRTPVGAFPENALGLSDLHGNVCEWVADAWHCHYVGAPTDGTEWEDSSSDRRVIRGGAWDHLPRLLRSSWRDGIPAGTKRDNVGFRIAATLER
jgi:formylglycine-generating enzyme required for sulfatase activity